MTPRPFFALANVLSAVVLALWIVEPARGLGMPLLILAGAVLAYLVGRWVERRNRRG